MAKKQYTDEELDELLAVYAALTEQKNDIEKNLKERRAQLLEILDERKTDELLTEYHKAVVSTGSRTTFDTKRFAADHPRLAPKYTKTSTYPILKVL